MPRKQAPVVVPPAKPVVITPHRFQRIALDSKERFIACLSGIQGGKTFIGAVWLLREIQAAHERGVHGDWMIVAPTYNILQQSTLVKFHSMFPKDWGRWKEQRKEFTLDWGGTIFVRSADEPEHLEGITALGAWLDEAGQYKYQAWINIQGRLSINKGRAIITSTPYATNWLHREIVKKAATLNGEPTTQPDTNPDVALVAWTSVDNPAFPREEYERAKASMSKELFDRRYNGNFTRLEGLVYPEFNHATCMVEPFPVPGHWKRFAGMDFGNTAPTAIVCVAEKPAVEANKETGVAYEPAVYYVYREFYKSRALLSQVAEFLKQDNLSYVLSDPQGAQNIDELKRAHGLRRVLPADNSKDMGFERIRVLLKDGRLKFFKDRTESVISEIEEYHYPAPDPDRNPSDQPVKKDDHTMDALRYAFSRTLEGLYRRSDADIRRVASRTERIKEIREQQRAAADPHTGYF